MVVGSIRQRFYLMLHDGMEFIVARILLARRLARVYRQVAAVPACPLVFDVGAHRGESVTFFRSLFPESEIHCFEPDRESFRILGAHCGSLPGIRLNNFALGAVAGQRPLFRHFTTSQSSFNRLNHNSWRVVLPGRLLGIPVASLITACEPVTVRTLDEYAAECGITRIDIVKLDTEETEYECLLGAARILRQRGIGMLQVEVRARGGYETRYPPEALERFLAEFGYHPVHRVRHPFPWHHVHEVFFRCESASPGRPAPPPA